MTTPVRPEIDPLEALKQLKRGASAPDPAASSDPLEQLKALKAAPARQPLIKNTAPPSPSTRDEGPGYGERLATAALSGAQVLPGMKTLEAAAGAAGSRVYHAFDKSQPVLSYPEAYRALEDNMEGMGTGRVLASQLAAAPMLTPMMAARGVRALGVAGSGAALGGTSRALDARPGQSATDVALETGLSAAAGGAAGYVAPKVVGALTKTGSKLVTALGLRPSGQTAEEMATDAARMRAPLGPEGSPRTMQSAMGNSPSAGPEPTTGQRVRALSGRAMSTVVEPAKKRALRQVADALSADNVNPADAIAYAERNPDKPIAVLDLGAGNVAGLARASVNTPGLGRRMIPEFLNERSAGVRGDEGRSLQRITSDFENRIGLKPENYFQTVNEMLAEQKALSKPAYDKVRDLPVDDGEVLSLFDIPEFRFAHKAVANAERIRPNGLDIKPLSETTTVGGQRVKVQNPQTLGTLDKMRQYIGDVARGKLEDRRIDRNTARAMLERLDAATTRLDELHPDYAEARAGYSGRARSMDAYAEGKEDFLAKDPREISARLAELKPGEADVYRRGAYDALRANKLTKMEDGANIGAFLEKNPDIRARVAALAKDPAAGELLRDDLGVERNMGARKALISGNSTTAAQLQDLDKATRRPAVTIAGDVARTVPGIGKMVGAAIDNRLTRRTAEETGDVMGEVAKIMTRSGVGGIRMTADEVNQVLGAQLAQEFARAGKYGSVAGSSASRLMPRNR